MNSIRTTVPIFLGILILASSSGIQLAPSIIQKVHAEPAGRIVGYLPYWESGDFDYIDYSKVTDVIYFHIWPNPDGSLNTSAINQNDLETIRDRAHNSGVNILIAVGGGGFSESFPEVVQNAVIRETFVSNLINFTVTNNLDGVDIDWETPIDQTKIDNQDTLLLELVNGLHPLGKLVTVAANGEVVELKANAGNSVDWVNIMAYDMNWGYAEHSTYADSVAALERYQTEGILKEKLALGIPFYGRNDNSDALKYEEIVSLCNPQPSSNTCNGYFFNGIDVVNQKTQHVLDQGYFGVMVWNLGQDTYDQTSLLNTINETLTGEPTPNNPIHLENLEISKSGNKRWSATAQITVFNQNNNPVFGTTVTGEWSGGSVGVASCTTDYSGQCNVSKSTNGDYLTFRVNDLVGSNTTYDSSSNAVNESISVNRDGTIPGQNTPPTADSGGPYSGQINNSIDFDGTGSSDLEGNLTYLWDFGDGATSAQSNPSHAYTAEGDYNAILTVSDNEGLTDIDSTTVTISAQSKGLRIDSISPNLMVKGQTVTVIISGAGFDQSTIIKFAGDKYLPSVINTVILDENTIEIDVTRSTAGPKKDFVYDVTATNINGDEFTLQNSFTVTN